MCECVCVCVCVRVCVYMCVCDLCTEVQVMLHMLKFQHRAH